MKKMVLFLMLSLLLCACAAPEQAQTELPTVTEEKVVFCEEAPEQAQTYALEQFYSFFPYSSSVENNWCGAVDNLDEYNYPDVAKAFPGGLLRKYEYGPGKYCNYSVYNVQEGGRFYVFWDTVRGAVEPAYKEALPEMWSATMLYVPALKSYSDFESLENGVSTGADVTAIDPGGQFVFTLDRGIPSWHLLEDGSMLEILYTMPEDCGCNYARDKLIVSSKELIAAEDAWCALAHIDPEDLP